MEVEGAGALLKALRGQRSGRCNLVDINLVAANSLAIRRTNLHTILIGLIEIGVLTSHQDEN